MNLQRTLRFGTGVAVGAIATRVPDRCREEAVVLYARLIARAAKSDSRIPKKEATGENVTQ